jgi:hypothetical protein
VLVCLQMEFGGVLLCGVVFNEDYKAGLGFCDILLLSDRCFLGTYDEDFGGAIEFQLCMLNGLLGEWKSR